MKLRKGRLGFRAAVLACTLAGAIGAAAVVGTSAIADKPKSPDADTTTPIHHVVVIFDENISFDHYFATYPNAANPPGEPPFVAAKGTPAVNGLSQSLQSPNNPNIVQPFRIDRQDAETCSQNHGYTAEQQADDAGLVDKYVQATGAKGTNSSAPGAPPCTAAALTHSGAGLSTLPGSQVMGYFDGNTVTAMWNYAQNFAMNDNSFGSNFGPSSVGAINLISGQTHGFAPAVNPANPNATFYSDVSENGTVIGDPQPAGDICDTRDRSTETAGGKNIGDLLNAKGVTWGWFEGGFREAPGAATCTVAHTNRFGVKSNDYIPHHEPFQFYASTQNLNHLPPTSVDNIGKTDQANHQYDLSDWYDALNAGNLPAVSYLKAPGYQDGHPGYSDPLDEQQFVVNAINALEKSPFWHDTAVIIAYDDSDGWYDHVMSPINNQSADPKHDAIRGALSATTGLVTNGDCGSQQPQAVDPTQQDRCGYGVRQPLLVISPYAKANFVDNTLTDQTSILRFIEDNWSLGRIGGGSFDAKAGTLLNMFTFGPGDDRDHGANKLFLDPSTGEPADVDP
ncbi:MAG TPA: alkaline phosphatase family protein [Gaiellaceae bacterium]|nr:alkaline phosphatase family protein [Gaiellaceae bacterium]